MLRAVVFDDEYIVLEGLRMMIDWSTYGIELAGTAMDGIAALSCFRETQPDIVFTDIRMPGMTGLQLIEKIIAEKPDTYCVVFSGFNEFEYVRSAIKLGVIDYLEKPISIQSIENALYKIQQHNLVKQEQETLKKQLEESQSEMLADTTHELLQGKLEQLPKWQKLLGLDFDNIKSITVIKFAEGLEWPKTSNFRLIISQKGDERLALLLHFEQPEVVLWEVIRSLSGPLPIGIGGTYSNIEQLTKSYYEAQKEYGVMTNESTKHGSIERAKAYIEQNYARDLSLNEVSEHVNMNATYLSVLFKEVIGESYIKFLTRYRMEHAKELLRKGTKVNDVSELVGYRTYRHFAEVFKKYTGQTPGQYKEEL
ncbi:response regulator [Paenibacillus sp. strain BS8-2]